MRIIRSQCPPWGRLIGAILIGLGSGALANDPAPPAERPGWVLTFQDEFSEPHLDGTRWVARDPWGTEKNNELQGYAPGAFSVQEGVLQIRCEKTTVFYDGKTREYRSGMLTTLGRFSQCFGRFEVRCRVPRGKGLWPAFWMLPDPLTWPPEIDVLEILGHDTDQVYLSHHWPDPKNPGGKSLSQTENFRGPDFAEAFHTFAVEWEATEIRWYVDGVERHRATKEIPQGPMFLLLNLAVGGWAEAPDETTVFPALYEIDYVRAWQRAPE